MTRGVSEKTAPHEATTSRSKQLLKGQVPKQRSLSGQRHSATKPKFVSGFGHHIQPSPGAGSLRSHPFVQTRTKREHMFFQALLSWQSSLASVLGWTNFACLDSPHCQLQHRGPRGKQTYLEALLFLRRKIEAALACRRAHRKAARCRYLAKFAKLPSQQKISKAAARALIQAAGEAPRRQRTSASSN